MINHGIHFTYALNCQVHKMWFSEIQNFSDDPGPSLQLLPKIKSFSLFLFMSPYALEFLNYERIQWLT